jgi:hypothetical protein
MAIDEGIDVLTMKTKGRLDDESKRTIVDPKQNFDQMSRGQLLDDNQSNNGNNSNNKNDEGAMCRQGQ